MNAAFASGDFVVTVMSFFSTAAPAAFDAADAADEPGAAEALAAEPAAPPDDDSSQPRCALATSAKRPIHPIALFMVLPSGDDFHRAAMYSPRGAEARTNLAQSTCA